MNYSETELILLLRPIVMQRTGKTLAEANDHLEILAVDELRKIYRNAIAIDSPEIIESQEKLRQIQAESHRETAFFKIFRTAVKVGAVDQVPLDNAANRHVIESWVHEDQGEELTPAWFAQVLRAQPQLARQLSWQNADVLDPAKRRQAEAAQAAEERRVFHDFCRDNGFAEVDANFSLVKSVLGSFDQYSLAQAVQSNALQLAEASPEELEKFRQEQIANRNRYLRSLDLTTLRKVVREEGARGPATPPLDETQRMRQAETTAATTYPVLPDEYRDGDGPEQVLNAQFIKACSAATLKRLIQRYGSAQIDEVLRGETRTEEVWKY